MKFNTTDQIKDIVSGVKVPSALGLFFVLATTALLAKKVKARAAFKDADEDVDDEYDKATDAIIRKMARDNHVETQQNARDIQALAVGHNELVRKVEGHRGKVDEFLAEFNKTQRWVKEVAAEVGVPMETMAAAIEGDGSAKKQFFLAAAAYQVEPARPRALEAADADDGDVAYYRK